MGARAGAESEWADRIRRLLSDLKISQAVLAERLGVSPPTVSRWLQGHHEPTAESYIALGNLARPPEGVYFWERAGMDTSRLLDSSSLSALSSVRVSLRDLHFIAADKVTGELASTENAVALPLLNATAYGDRIPPHENVSLSQVAVEAVLFAPIEWCPHPEHMVAMHLAGDSMVPTINPGSVLFVDTGVKDRDLLHQRIAVVAHRDLGFKVARLQRLGGSDLLVSANYKFPPVDISNASKWKIFGEVLWWLSRDSEGKSEPRTPVQE